MSPSIRDLEPGDAEGLVACFRRCYGETYPNEDFYDAATLRQAIETGRLRSVVAVADDGLLVGHTGITARFDGANVIEAGNTVVDPAMRGHGLLTKMGAALHGLCHRSGYGGFVHYPTTAHEVMQRVSVSNKGVETGIMLAYIPAETDYRAFDSNTGRLAATIAYQPLSPLADRAVVFPNRYEELLAELYDAAELPRGHAPSGPAAPQSIVSVDHRRRRGLIHLSVQKIGLDLASAVEAGLRVEPAVTPAVAVMHVDLPLDDPAINVGVETLVEQGFFYAGLLPEFGPGDVIRLQRLSGGLATATPRPDQSPADRPTADRLGREHRPDLANDGARRLLEFINRDATGLQSGP